MYDFTLSNAEVFDGSGGKSYFADVSVKNGKIAHIGPVSARETAHVYNCEKLALTPGFIDVHTHSDSQILHDPLRTCKLLQGVTTEIGGQCGLANSPILPNVSQAAKDNMRIMLHIPTDEFPAFESHGEYLRYVEKFRIGTNQAFFIGHNTLRASVMGMENREASEEELSRMKAIVAEAMRSGAMGLSTGLVYAPGCYSSRSEIIELARVVAQYGGIYTSHIRNEADSLLDAVSEVVDIAMETGVTANISHLKVMYERNNDLLEKAVEMIENANKQGGRIFFDVYPYDACSAHIISCLPPSYLEHDTDWMIEHLQGEEMIQKLEDAIFHPTEVWENPLKGIGFEKDLIIAAKETPDAVGKTLAEYAKEKGLRPIEAFAKIIVDNRGNASDIRFAMSEKLISGLYRNPLCMVGTDGLYWGDGAKAHPRAFATFPRYLGRYIREMGVLPFEEGIHRITGLAAERYGLKGKGLIKENYDADLVLFDKNSIIDQADYTDPFRPNLGIKMVFVGGEAAVVDNKPTGVYNGALIRREALSTE